MHRLINFFPSFTTQSFPLSLQFKPHDYSAQLKALILVLSLTSHDSEFLAIASFQDLQIYPPSLFVATRSTNLPDLALKFKFQAMSVSKPNLV